MPAIVRQTMSRALAQNLLDDVQNSSNEYYIGIGKSDAFSDQDDLIIDPIDCPRDEREFRSNLQSIKMVEDSTFVAKRVNWSSGSIYSGWDDTTPSDIVEPWTPWYVMNDAKEVYICIEQGKALNGTPTQSIVEPNYGLLNITDYTQPFNTTDGYTWKFLYSLRPETIFQFLSSNHIPVQEAEPSLPTGDPIEDLQTSVMLSAIGGQITRIRVEDGGSGYASEPTITIHGDGTGAAATAVIDGGVVTKIIMSDYGSGYTYASLEIASGVTECVAFPVITTKEGLGHNPIHDLKTSSILMNIKPDGDVDGTFITGGNTFRQMGLIKNPTLPDGTTPFTGVSVKTLPSMTLASTSPFETGKKITGTQSGAVAYVNESVDAEVFYHQNESTGIKPFQVGEAVVQSGIVLTGDIATLSPVNGIDRFSGEVLYIESRNKIRRDSEQQEDIKIVITV